MGQQKEKEEERKGEKKSEKIHLSFLYDHSKIVLKTLIDI